MSAIHTLYLFYNVRYKCALMMREEREDDIKVDLHIIIFLGCLLVLFKNLVEVCLHDVLFHKPM